MISILSYAFIALGFFFVVAGTIGLIRMPDFFSRIHALGMSDSLGLILILVGLALAEGLSWISLKIFLIAIFYFLAGPTTVHLLGRAAYRSGLFQTDSKREYDSEARDTKMKENLRDD